MKRIRKKDKDRAQGLFIKMAFVYSSVLVIVLVVVFLSINYFCVKFIKEQCVEYNTRILHETAYEMKDVYSEMDYLLLQLCSEDKYSKEKMKSSIAGESVFERIKREVDFIERVKNSTYTNGIGEFYKGILFFDGTDDFYYIGDGVVNQNYAFSALLENFNPDISTMQMLGPMKEDFLKDSSLERKVIGFVKMVTSDGDYASNKQTSSNQYVMITVDIEKMVNVLKNMLLDDKKFFITDEKNNIFYSSGIEDPKAWQVKLNGQNGTAIESEKGLLVTSVDLEEYGWHLSVVDEEKVLFRDVDSLKKKVSTFITVGGILSIFLFLFISRKILFPVGLLKKMLYQVAKDNDTYLEVVSKDEVGEISKLINEMKKKIKNLTENQYYLEMKTTEARMQVLQSQINPHFLYNTLDNVYCIAQIEEIEPICILTRNLSEMLRYSIDTKHLFVSLKQEIQYVEAYLNIINIRYEDRIQLQLEVEEGLLNCQVFKLLLQPLVENACLHGILPSTILKGLIQIFVKRSQADIEIEVRNNGVILSDEDLARLNERLKNNTPPMSKEQKKGFGIALENVNERLNLYYGSEYGMVMERIDNWGTCVRILQKYIEQV